MGIYVDNSDGLGEERVLHADLAMMRNHRKGVEEERLSPKTGAVADNSDQHGAPAGLIYSPIPPRLTPDGKRDYGHLNNHYVHAMEVKAIFLKYRLQ